MKILNVIIIVLISSFISFAQNENESQSIELPEFVITGIRKVDIPIIKKKKPELISGLSEEFFMPSFSSEEFNPTGFSSPFITSAEVNKIKSQFNSLLRAELGTVTLPKGEFYYNNSLSDVLINFGFIGRSEREFVNKAGYNYVTASIGAKYFVDHTAEVLPGLGITFNARYLLDSYNLYGSQNPSFTRETDNAQIGISLFNKFTAIKYGLNLTTDLKKFRENNLSENLLNTSAFLSLPVNGINFRADGQIKHQSMQNNLSGIGSYNYYSLSAKAKLKLLKPVEITGGLFYSIQGDNKFFSPQAAVTTKFSDKIFLTGEFSPSTTFLSRKDLTSMNRFYKLNATDNIYLKEKYKTKAALVYKYLKYFQVSVGGSYARIDNLPYFVYQLGPGDFTLATLNRVDKTKLFLNLLFFQGPSGELFGAANYQSVLDANGNQVPYYPKFGIDINYSYPITQTLNAKAKLNYSSGIFTDLANKNRLNNYLNLSVYLNYKLSKNLVVTFSAENLLNRKNFLFENYRAKTIDVYGGFEYRW